MKRTILPLMLLLLLSVPVLADIAMPPGYASWQGDYGIARIGAKFQGLPNGDIVVLVYREAWPYNGATEIHFEPGQPRDVAARRVIGNFEDLRPLTYLGKTEERSVGNKIWRIDAYLWPSHLPKDGLGPFCVYAHTCADVVSPADGTIEHLQARGDFYPTPATKNLRLDSSVTPGVLALDTQNGVNPIPLHLSDRWPYGNTTATIDIYSLQTGQRVAHKVQSPVGAVKSTSGVAPPDDWNGSYTWDGTVDEGGTAPKGLYTYNVTVSHTEDGWAWSNATGNWPFWIGKEYDAGWRTIANGSTNGTDADQRITSSASIVATSATLITDPDPAPEPGMTPLLFTYNVSINSLNPEAYLTDTGVKIYGPNLTEVASHNVGFALAGEQSVRVDVDVSQPGDYYYVLDAMCEGKPALEKGGKLDLTPPAITITNPVDGQINKASGQTAVQLMGTATDSETGIISVEVKIDSGQWQPATYNAASHTWSYNWQNPQSGTIWARATDFAGHVATISRVVTDSTVTVTYVNGDTGNNSNNGTSWSLAKKTVAAALTAASSGEIWVKQGLYQERITLRSGVALYGGFTGTETYREQRNWATNKTALDGNQGGTVVTVPSGATAATAIDGFTIRNGSYSYGGGIYAYNASATIMNCIIRANNGGSYGGGLWAQLSTLKVAGNVFVSNTSSTGGAICYKDSGGQIANNTIIKNTASSNGGGIYAYVNTTSTLPALANNIIAFNNGGGIYASSSTISLTKNDVYGNNANGKYEYNWTTSYPVNGDLTPTPPQIPYIDYDDFHIAGASPCHDPLNTSLAVPMDSDIDAESRIYNGSTVDIGADEWSGSEPQVPTSSVIYVKPSGNDSNNGMSWDAAVATVQKGIDFAYATGNCEVWVTAGNYTPTSTINLKPGVRLYGGFAGTEATREQRNWSTNQTVLDGNNSRTVVTIQSNGTVANTVIDGFIVQHGSANNGGGIYAYNASATIANNIIRANTGTYGGGGLYGSSFPLNILGNVFVRNNSGSGAGIYLSNVGGQVANNTIIGNGGTGIYFGSNSTFPTLSNNIIAFNSGGGIYKSSGTLSLIRNDVYGNNGNGNHEYSWTTTYPVGTDLTPTDPGIPYIGYGDWHIAATSPCHDPQDTVLPVPMDRDIDGESRLYNDTTVDIGADEWNGSEPQVPTLDIIYVKPSTQGGSDSNNGKSWGTAVATIQKGVDLAYSNSSEVWVAAGTYSGTSGKATLKSFAKLYGGFAIGDTSRSARNWKNNPTILDGNGSGSVITISNVIGCAVDGFTIRNGAGYYYSYNYYGGGFYCSSAIATITNNIIRSNNTINSSSSSYGGGLYAQTSNLIVAGNVFIDNKAASGGGIYYKDTIGPIANNTIISNSAGTDGGGIYVYSGSPALSNNIVAFNTGGGIYRYTGATPALTKDDVYGNSVYQYNWTTAYPVDGDLTPTPPGIPYVDYGDWHIASSSPCHDPQGTVLAVPMDKDIDRESRPYNGSTVDIGADEWNNEPQVPTPTIIYVKPGGSDSKSGNSWDNAVASVQKGIDLAYGTCGEVWVAAGTYTKTGSATTVANLKSFVKVYGGFAVGDGSKGTRNWKTNKTILDGGASGAVVTAANAVNCQIDGFSIRNGSGYQSGGGMGYTYYYGGGVYCSSASVNIMNNIIRVNNVGTSTSYGGGYGGGIYASGCTITVAGNVLVSNTGGYGGGIYCASSSGNIANNTIISNNGVGIYLGSGSPLPVLSNNIVAFNTGGGVYKTSDIPTCTKNDVSGNGSYQYSWTTTYPVGTDLSPTDPGIPYLDYGDWHIAGSSPCHDPQGTVLAVSMDKDIDAEDRPYNGSTVDIGADEWNGADPQVPTPDVICVKPSAQGGNDSNDGTSWAAAVATVQKGIDLAYIKGNCEVWVAAGTYAKANLKPFVKLYGGFAVNDAIKAVRNWKSNPTILDGGANGNTVTIANTTGCVVDGFIIRNGGAANGSGISCSNATATIANNIIRANNAGSYYGGGLYASNSTLTVAGNVFVDNKAYYGAGIYYTSTNGQIANNTIIRNFASNACGGVYLQSASPALSNNIVGFNVGGGIYKYAYGGSPTFTKNDVYGNSDNGKYEYSWTTSYPVDTDLVPADPAIPNVDWGDWHIAETSPWHDPENTALAVSMEKDIDNGSRVYGSTVDIGADEWDGSSIPSAPPTVIYVKPSSQGGNDSNAGTDWTSAVATVQRGIDLAYGAGGGEVWVAVGTYAKATLKSFVKLYGGFTVGDGSRQARDWGINQTILDGGSSGKVVTIDTVVGCQVDGFIIRNGATANGSGVYCSNATATIANNIIRNNNAGTGYGGGGLYASNSILSVVGNVLVNNSAGYGGGIYYNTGTAGQIVNNTIIVNTASSDAGGVYLNGASPAMSNNIIASNVGGGIYKSGGSPTFAKNDVYGNNANGKYEYNWTTAYPVGTDLVPADPGIPSIGTDWHIAQGSPCIDPEGTISVSDKDIDCGNRVVGSTVDIGADEWKGSSPKITLARSTSCSTVHATWNAYSGDVQNYYYAIGTSPTSTDIRDWTDAGGASTLETNATGLSLDQTATYYFLLKVRQTDQQWSEIDTKQIDIGPNKLTLSIGSLTESPIRVTATAKDHFGNPLNTVVHLSSNSGTIDTPDASTGSSGTVDVHIQGACLGVLTVTAYIEDTCGNRVDASASAAANTLSITAPANVAANSTVAVTAAVKDSANNPVQRASIIFSTDSGTLDSEQATTGSNGTATVHVSGPCAGTTTVTAYIESGCENPTTKSVLFEVHPDVLALSSQDSTVAAGVPVTITATATNYTGTRVDRQIHFWTTGGTLDVTDGATGSDGQIATNLTCTTGGPVVVYASMDDSYPCGGRTTKAVLVNVISDTQISLDAEPGTGEHADRIKITATVKDIAGNPVGRTVNFSASSGTIDSTVQSSSDGIAEAYATYPSEGFLTVFAWVDDAGGNRKSCSLSFSTTDNLVLDITPAYPTPGASVTVNARVTDFKGNPADREVHFSTTVGSITPTSEQSGSDGLASASTTCPTSGEAVVTAYVAMPGGGYAPASIPICNYSGDSHKVGFLYYLARPGEYVNNFVDNYLERIDAHYSDVVYERIDSTLANLDTYDTIFVVMPQRSLTSAETQALAAFVSNRGKRLVLSGEWTTPDTNNDGKPEGFYECNGMLNGLLSSCGVSTRFQTGGSGSWAVDSCFSLTRTAPVESCNLTNGVTGLWYACTSAFTGWESNGIPLAYPNYSLYDPAYHKPWIVEEPVPHGGSVVCIHDTNFFQSGENYDTGNCSPYIVYDDTNDTVPNKNFKFVHNLCTVENGDLGLMRGPNCFVPGHPNKIKYHLANACGYGKLEIFARNSAGSPTGTAIYTSTALDLTAGDHTFTYSGTEISCDPGKYIARLTYGPDVNNTQTAEMQFDVKCWDLIWLFEDQLTDEEKAAIDQAQMDIPDDYVEEEDPMAPDGPTELGSYCAGIDANTVNSSKVTMKVWYWNEDEANATSLSIDNGVSTTDITDKDWLNTWGQDLSRKPYYDERGSVITNLNGTFYSMSDSDQYFYVKVTVADDGVMDNAGNPYDADPSTPEIEKSVKYKLKIDHDGNTSVLEETYE